MIVTIAGQDQIQELRANERFTEILKRALVRACHDAYAQGGVLTTTDLGVLFHRGHGRIAEMICQYEEETGQMVPRRGTVHDLGGSVTHKRLIFAIQRPRYVVEAYGRMIAEFGLAREQVYERSGVALELENNQIEPAFVGNTSPDEPWGSFMVAGGVMWW